MESETMSRVKSQFSNIAEEFLLLEVDERLDLLVVFVGWSSWSETDWMTAHILLLTSIFGLRDDFSKQFREIWQILSEEFGFDNEGFSGMVCDQLTSKQLRLSCNAKSRSFVGVLDMRLSVLAGIVMQLSSP